MTGSDIADLISVGNQSALQWYSTATQKPVQTGLPSSMMRSMFGTDLSGGPTTFGQTVSPIGLMLLVGVIVIGIVIIVKK